MTTSPDPVETTLHVQPTPDGADILLLASRPCQVYAVRDDAANLWVTLPEPAADGPYIAALTTVASPVTEVTALTDLAVDLKLLHTAAEGKVIPA